MDRARRISRFAVAVASILVAGIALAGCSAASGDPVAVPTPPTTADLPAALQKQLRTAVTEAMKATDSSGAIVTVTAPWAGTWTAALGVTSPGGKTPVTTDMTFRAGQITRAMTCDALYRVAAAGKVKLTDSIADYMDGIQSLKDATLGDLCDSTSGIGSYGGQLASDELDNPGRAWDPNELIAYGLGATPDGVSPGDAYRASDAGYVLLGQALQKATGQTPAQILANQVFRPLGLTSTALPGDAPNEPVVGDSTALPGYVVRQDAKGNLQCKAPTDITTMSASFGSTDSGVVTDITDLSTYVRALATGGLVPDKSRFENALAVSTSSPVWFTAAGGAVKAGTLIGQYGKMPGYLTAAFSEPTSGLTVAVVLNNSTADRTPILSLAWELAALASKAPATAGETAPAAGLPWTAATYAAKVTAHPICGS
ncbi:MAG TPA: serine hydrolase domain-containing protein [Microbacterium sp.]|uniref:serine hydrolase domain-containing protein n=1 Tax=Microbacterium sp. TaxID=51671 RepID=UPI002B4A397C|nr:serine hydrolase domain-containing protein [Microbacterium sp.]HKT58125.1 serine hydrolase domain-containing protein [Microbacterium sp.]